ncbi:hypothetical protein [Methylobacterium radiotolerans]|uniref:hypothetical protein n=1 Tax=Methylobacterium radiotolerans TaxID=31998 RepID=UPI001F373163|nr:hypothetical protein [Methylobacterium radiotolerans]UIY44151.1 hypothetical protein LZ599_10880 [Methylobacterium radiotolerans]
MTRVTRLLTVAAALFIAALPAGADQILGPGRITGANKLVLPGGPTLGTYQNNKFISQPDAIQIQGSGSTGDVSGMSATPTDTGVSQALGAAFAARLPVTTAQQLFSTIKGKGDNTQNELPTFVAAEATAKALSSARTVPGYRLRIQTGRWSMGSTFSPVAGNDWSWISGEGPYKTVITRYDTAATPIISFDAGANNGTFQDAPTRLSDLTVLGPGNAGEAAGQSAVYVRSIGGFEMDHVHVSGNWRGVNLVNSFAPVFAFNRFENTKGAAIRSADLSPNGFTSIADKYFGCGKANSEYATQFDSNGTSTGPVGITMVGEDIENCYGAHSYANAKAILEAGGYMEVPSAPQGFYNLTGTNGGLTLLNKAYNGKVFIDNVVGGGLYDAYFYGSSSVPSSVQFGPNAFDFDLGRYFTEGNFTLVNYPPFWSPSLLNGWALNSDNRPVGAKKVSTGVVYLRGRVAAGSASSSLNPVISLADRYKPREDLLLDCWYVAASNGAKTRGPLLVSSNGNIVPQQGTAAGDQIWLDGVSYMP